MNESILDEIVKRIAKRPNIKYKREAKSLSILPEDAGFEVRIDVKPYTFIVSFKGWHEEFTKESDALNCFAFGLSNECRLQIEMRGSSEVRWTVQSLQGETWLDDSYSALMFFPFWRKRSVVHLRNHFIAD